MNFPNNFFIICSVMIAGFFNQVLAGPPGAPGADHRWGAAAKEGVGTAYEEQGANSPVWFTVAQGILTEVYYPTVDQVQVGDLQFLVTDGRSFFSEQKRDTKSTVTYSEQGATVQVAGEEKNGVYRYHQEIVTDPRSPVVRIHTSLQSTRTDLHIYILFKPAMGGTGSKNFGEAGPTGLFASRDDFFSALTSTTPWKAASVGYVGSSDGWQDLSKNFRLTQTWPDNQDTGAGNIALVGELDLRPASGSGEMTYDLALAFGRSQAEAVAKAQQSSADRFEHVRQAYNEGWEKYLSALSVTDAFSRRSAEIIKMHEDKTFRGGIVASLSIPAVPDSNHAPETNYGGYHLVWPRDLYHAAMGLLAAGDVTTPTDVLHYYESTQKPDGTWSQNMWLDGHPYWTGLQMDEVAFPILLASQLQARGFVPLDDRELQMVRRAADFLSTHGPVTAQDRWEEIGGYVPSTLAAEIAALEQAAKLTKIDSYAHTARKWKDQLDSWTVVKNGVHGQNYYLRVSPSGHPDDGEAFDIANNSGRAQAAEIIDGGFLELVRMKVRDPHDANILSTLQIYDNPATGIQESLLYRRYNRDGYGPEHVGGLWPILAGERGHYALAAGDRDRAKMELSVLENSAFESGLIPEQMINTGMVGPGVASPLVWAHAEDILLHRSIEEGKVFDAPQ